MRAFVIGKGYFEVKTALTSQFSAKIGRIAKRPKEKMHLTSFQLKGHRKANNNMMLITLLINWGGFIRGPYVCVTSLEYNNTL